LGSVSIECLLNSNRGIHNTKKRHTRFTLPWGGRVGETSSVARCEPGWGELSFLHKRSPHPDASLPLGIDPPPPGEGEARRLHAPKRAAAVGKLLNIKPAQS